MLDVLARWTGSSCKTLILLSKTALGEEICATGMSFLRDSIPNSAGLSHLITKTNYINNNYSVKTFTAKGLFLIQKHHFKYLLYMWEWWRRANNIQYTSCAFYATRTREVCLCLISLMNTDQVWHYFTFQTRRWRWLRKRLGHTLWLSAQN